VQPEAPSDAVRAELARVLSSSVLALSPRQAELLKFLVEQTLYGHGHELKESVIAAEVYGDSDYDSKRQANVRSEIRRLRLGLLEHYANRDAPPPIRIEIQKGSYRPQFLVEDPAVSRDRPANVRLPAERRPSWAILATAAIGVALLPVALVEISRTQVHRVAPARVESALVRKGRHFLQLRTPTSLQKALACFEQAIREDSTDARAWGGLAETQAAMVARGQVRPAIYALSATNAAHRALERDASLAQPHLALATIKTYYEWDWLGAENEYLEAIRLDPADADNHRGYAMHLLILKRFDEARSQAKLAQQLDPVSFAVNEGMEIVDLYSGRLDEAAAEARNLKELYPDFDVSKILRVIYLEEVHHGDTQARQPFVLITTLRSQAPTLDGRLIRTALAADNQQWPEAKRGYEDMVRLSMSTYIPPTTLSLLKGNVFGWKGELFATAYKEHDPALVWCRYLDSAPWAGGSDLPEVVRKMGLQ
jgi:tetratricopeptide (TPR) repeat protein